MRQLFYRIFHSEFLTFSEVLRLKVSIVNVFLIILIILTIPISSINDVQLNYDILMTLSAAVLVFITVLLVVFNFNRIAMHTSILSILLLTTYYVTTTSFFFTYLLFFVGLTIIIFYQDIITYLLYGGALMVGGVYYVYVEGASLIGANSISAVDGGDLSSITYQAILVAFYIVFFIQFLISDNIYEKLNNEYVRMNRTLEKYQNMTHSHLVEMIESNNLEPIYKNVNFQQAVSELSVFMNEFFEEDGNEIAEVSEFYFFIHSRDINSVIDDSSLPVITRKYALEFKKYLLNQRSEMVSILFDFSTLFQDNESYSKNRYNYNIDELYKNRINKLLALSIVYKYLKSEITQFDKWGQVTGKLSHEDITKLFLSPEFREYITFEQVNFYIDNEELFKKYL